MVEAPRTGVGQWFQSVPPQASGGSILLFRFDTIFDTIFTNIAIFDIDIYLNLLYTAKKHY